MFIRTDIQTSNCFHLYDSKRTSQQPHWQFIKTSFSSGQALRLISQGNAEFSGDSGSTTILSKNILHDVQVRSSTEANRSNFMCRKHTLKCYPRIQSQAQSPESIPLKPRRVYLNKHVEKIAMVRQSILFL